MAEELSLHQGKKKQSELIAIVGLLTVIIGILTLIFLGDTNDTMATVGIVILVVGIIVFIVGLIKFNLTVKKFKKTFLKDYFSKIIEEGSYFPKRYVSPQAVYGSGFLKRADRFKGKDYLSGKIDGIEFESSDIHLQERQVYTDSKGHRKTKYVTYFKGRIFKFDFHKPIEHRLQVLEKYRPRDGYKYKKVELESIDFNKKFKTYATDAHTAFYVLTPHFMEALMKIEQNHPGKLGFSFMEEKMYFAINNNKSTFPIYPFVKIDERLVDTFKEDVEMLYELVDDLKLNKRIFKED